MTKALDATGRRFTRLVGVEMLPRAKGQTFWRFACDCGKIIDTHLASVVHGRTKSCGCLQAERRREVKLTHGHTVGSGRPREYNAWAAAKGRCTNQKNHAYALYGGRGIEMHPRWIADFAAFLSDMGPRPGGTSLDRIETNGNYEPGNCRWATAKQQARNRRVTRMVRHEGREIPLAELAELSGIPYKRLWARAKAGLTILENSPG